MGLPVIVGFIIVRCTRFFCSGSIEGAVGAQRCFIHPIPGLICFFPAGDDVQPERLFTFNHCNTGIERLQG